MAGSIWAVSGLEQLQSRGSGYRPDAVLFERELQAKKKAEQRQRLQSDASDHKPGTSIEEAVAGLGFGVQVS